MYSVSIVLINPQTLCLCPSFVCCTQQKQQELILNYTSNNIWDSFEFV